MYLMSTYLIGYPEYGQYKVISESALTCRAGKYLIFGGPAN